MNKLTCLPQLKKSYNVVAVIKMISGYSWDQEKGANITIEQSCSWNDYVAVSTTTIW
jgi:hypothetical protein